MNDLSGKVREGLNQFGASPIDRPR